MTLLVAVIARDLVDIPLVGTVLSFPLRSFLLGFLGLGGVGPGGVGSGVVGLGDILARGGASLPVPFPSKRSFSFSLSSPGGF